MPKIQTRSSLQRLQFFAVADTAASTAVELMHRKRVMMHNNEKRRQRTSILRRTEPCGILLSMSATEIIEQFKALPPSERAQVAKFVVENDDSWIPESFKQGMADAEAGRFVDLDMALNETYPGDK